ncbi:hypothetical protein [Novosphingobium sp. FSW06-99]|uniref:hypothetical protein n=1 Tax=Novosphingobium sp. FSW06-99 TaxID=1739113 RepID=UPI00076D56D6|nr:hypothetical protein [Novosphingobium sp. FSW06-99]KUR76858.1 hypothetical protein AQZ49_11080 [Novosphingobium sp. FSW06-99]
MLVIRRLLLHPAARLLRIVLNVCLAAYFVWLVWSGGNAGYPAWAGLLFMTALNWEFERARVANSS